MRRRNRFTARALMAPAAAAMLALGGCADGVELNGSIFDAMGVSSIGMNKSGPKDVATRAPLVVPPNRSLPPPGPRQTAAADANWPNDPNEQIKQAEAERKRKLQEYYDHGDWSGEGGIDEFNKLINPIERRPGIFGTGKLKDKYRAEEFRQEPEKPVAETEGSWSTETSAEPQQQQ